MSIYVQICRLSRFLSVTCRMRGVGEGGRREEGGEGGGGSIYSYFFSVDRAVEAFNPDLILNKNK